MSELGTREAAEPWIEGSMPDPVLRVRVSACVRSDALRFCAASPVTEAEFKMFKQAMGEQGLSKSSTKDVSHRPPRVQPF